MRNSGATKRRRPPPLEADPPPEAPAWTAPSGGVSIVPPCLPGGPASPGAVPVLCARYGVPRRLGTREIPRFPRFRFAPATARVHLDTGMQTMRDADREQTREQSLQALEAARARYENLYQDALPTSLERPHRATRRSRAFRFRRHRARGAVQRCVHRASISFGAGKAWRRPRCKIRCSGHLGTREIPRCSDCGRSGTSGWRDADDARCRPGADARAGAGGGEGALREPVSGRARHVRLGDRRHRRVVQCNATLLRATGYRRVELLGRPIRDLHDPGSASALGRALETARADGRARTWSCGCGGRTATCWTSASAWRSSGTSSRTTTTGRSGGT